MTQSYLLRATCTFLIAFVTTATAEVSLPSILNSHMVLQQGIPVPVWGWAADGESVTVTFAGQKKTAKAAAGKWMVKLDPLKASAKAQELAVKGTNEIKLTDILVGEVWICSGQSNMEWSLSRSLNAKEEIAAANYPNIRLFDVRGHITHAKPQEKCNGAWAACAPDTTKGFSAVGYFFGRRLSKELNTPIGLVGSNWGGTRIEPWCSLDGFKSVPELKKEADRVVAQAEKGGKVGAGSPSAIYNAMIHPLAPFAMRGGIWYQGESNGGEGITYHHKKTALINGWRKLFNPDLAFYWVQLANFKKSKGTPEGGDGWAKLREAQRTSLQIPHTGMAVIHDIGTANNIHPPNKQDVGSRLAQWALAQTYKKDIVASGPLYKSQKVEGGKIRLSFDNVGAGLMIGKKEGLKAAAEVTGGKLGHFAVAGENKQWQWAEAKIDGSTVVVSSDKVTKPVAVRYGYAMNPAEANLYNKDGIPATPFRTDDW
ncbi:MAG: sialate O-acetylesterase [Rhodothermales bacterium]|jgi:sialate O-acetylesterase